MKNSVPIYGPVRAGFLPIQERDANNAVTREYLWGLNMGGGIGGLLNLKQGGLDYNYLYDGKGNVAGLINSAQATVAQYAYDPFGNVKKTGTLDQPYMFSTKPYDEKLGHVKYEFRTYSPLLGRWLTRDPLGEESDPNLYRAMRNDAVNFIDPDGKIVVAPAIVACLSNPWCSGAVLMGGAALGQAINKAITDNPTKCRDDNNDDDQCDRVLPKNLIKRFTGDAEQFKIDELGFDRHIARFELCGCKDGRVVIKERGCKGPIIRETSARWK